MRGHAHARQNRDVDLGMSEEPEQVLPKQGRSALVTHDLAIHDDERNVKACAEVAIHQEQNSRGEENAEGQQSQNRGDEPRPYRERHAHHGHALGPQVERGGDEVQRAHKRGHAENRDARDPEIGTELLAGPGVVQGAQWSVARPAVQRSPTGHEERRDDNDEADEGRPERQHVQDRERHVGRADLNRQKIISEAALGGGCQHEKHHDGAVHRQQAQIRFGLDLADHGQHVRRPYQVDAHQQREKHSDKHGGECQEEILNADDFVVQTEDVFPDETLRSVRVNRSRGRHFIVSPPPERPATCQNLPG